MKTKLIQWRKRIVAAGGLLAAVLALAAFSGKSNYVAHEWGTFTSVAGADGALLDWRPLVTSHLPSFVYDWTKPGLGRQANMLFGKGGMVSLQRMETPVIYFYSDAERTVDVSVQFPQGLITEWYPQVRQVGPARVPPPALVNTLDTGAHKAGLKPEFTFASLLPQRAAKDSRIVWSDVTILPTKQNADLASLIPSDKSGSHYFAARDTDAAFVRLDTLSRTNRAPEHEKFLFYRGIGNFETPLLVKVNPSGMVTVENRGKEALTHLFLLTVRDGRGAFVQLDKLQPGERRDWQRIHEVAERNGQRLPLAELQEKIGAEMIAALVDEGLYPREATAMVNTWKDSWFAEDGVRVLYLLPRAWTDRTLPIQLNPKPSALVRVMVGRAEIITPDMVTRLREALTQAGSGDAQAREKALAELTNRGRFAEAALRHVKDARATQTGWELWRQLADARRAARGS